MSKYKSPFLTSFIETKNWLDKHGITNYDINPDTLEIDVNGVVDLRHKNLSKIPVKFNYISQNFSCAANKLISLQGAPNKIEGGFWCYHNNLTTLEDAPTYVGGACYCDHNKLTTLKGAPEYVGGDFWCNANYLINLKHAPRTVQYGIICYDNCLSSLYGCPLTIGKEIQFDGNANIFNTINRYLKSANSIILVSPPYNIKGLMRIFLIKSIMRIQFTQPSIKDIQALAIINKHLQGDRSGPTCQLELIDAGLSDYAQM